MKTKFYLLLVLLFCLCNLGYSQTGIGAYSVHDGGFENHSTGNLAGGSTTNAALSTSLWTASTTANVVRTSNATGGRSGTRCLSLGSTNGTIKNFYSPQLAGAFAANTTYQVQFWYKTASTTALDASTVDIYVNNTSATQAPPIGTRQGPSAGLSTNISTWTKVAVSVTTNATAAGSFGVAGISIDAATAGYSADIDDFVVYQAGAADNTAPSSPGTVTATGASSTSATVSWGAASGGPDGGGYVVVRYASASPSASDDPLQNGIYKFNSAVGAGFVRYIGTSTSFTDTGLSAGVDYYYKVYTIDKAFNYSSESTTSSPVQALATTYYYDGSGPLTDITNWGTNTDGTGTNPANFIDVAQIFEIRNTNAVTLDGSWTVGTVGPVNGTKVRLGNTDQAAITLTMSPSSSILPPVTGNVDIMPPVSGKQTIIYSGVAAPVSLGNILDPNFEVIFDGTTVSLNSTKSFGTITARNSANVTFTDTPTIKNINVDESSTFVAPTNASSYITIPSGGSVTINGTVRVPKLTGFVSSNVGTAGATFGDFQFIGAENLTLGSNSVVQYTRDATGAQTVTARTDYKNVTLSGTSPKSIAGATAISGTFTINQTGSSLVTLTADTTVNGTLLFTNGKIDTGSNSLILGASAAISGAGTSSGWVIGNLRKTTISGASPSFIYTIGDTNYYTPLALTFSNNTSATGTLTARTSAGDHPQIGTSGITASNSINRTWTLTNANLAGLSSYNATFTYAPQDNDINALPQFFASRLYNGASWANLTTSGTPSSTSLSANSITGFGDFAIGQVCINPTSGGTISGAQSLCTPANPAAFASDALPSGHTGTLDYQWQSSTNNVSFSDIASANASTYNAPAGLTTTTYYKRLSRVSCQSDWTGAAESNVISVTVITTAAPSASAQTFCNAATVANLVATGTNLQWYSTATGGSSLAATTAVSTNTYYISQTLNDCESSRTAVAITVNVTLAPTASAQSFCNAATVSDLVATGTNLKWYADATGGTSLVNSTALATDTYYVSQTLNSCEGPRRAVVVTINTNPTSGGTISGAQSLCAPANPAAFANDALPSGHTGTLEYQWQSSTNNINFTDIAGAGASTYNAPFGLTTTTYYKRLSRVSCQSDWTGAQESNVITVTVSPVITTLFTQVDPICFGGTLSALPTTSNNGIAGVWSPAINSAATTVYTFTPSAGQCATTASMTITVNNSVAGTVSANQVIVITSQPANITLTNSSGAIQWQRSTNNVNFTDIVGATNSTLSGSQAGVLVTNTFFRAIVKSGNCTSAVSGVVSVTVGSITTVRESQCGTTLPNLNTDIHANNVPGTIEYRFKVTANGTTEVIERGNRRFFNLTALTNGAAYNTAYTISVATKYNGVWGNYGAECVVSTPTIAPVTSLRTAQCGAILATLNTDVLADFVPFVTDYRFKVVANGTTEVIERGSLRYFNLTALTGGAAYNTTYTISVAVKNAGVWGSYGADCVVSTPAPPTTKVQSSQCGATLASLNTDIQADWLQFATEYRFKVVNNTLGSNQVIERGNLRYFNLTALTSGASFNTTYTISVSVKQSGIWGAYGAECIVSTTAAPSTKVQASQCGATLAALNTDILADFLQFATAYRFKVMVGGAGYVVNTAGNNRFFKLTSLPIAITAGTTYSVSVAVQQNGVWGDYGTECIVRTPGGSSSSRQIVENTDFSLAAYPNPSNSAFKLQVNGSNNETVSVLVFDMTGRQIENKFVNANDIENISIGQNYSTGIYNVIVSQGMNTKTVRLVKK